MNYTKTHTEKKAFNTHLKKIKARIVESGGEVTTKGMTITYSFPEKAKKAKPAKKTKGKKVVKKAKGGSVKHEYAISVGNIGNIGCANLKEAEKKYKEYVKQSKDNYGRAAGEDVALMVDGEPEKEYFGSNDND